ncbi:MAG: glucose 1-dehydrogenase [Dehalococcoidia bacterium]|nr:glucose 1-dehydrogenase [Dehalococcoidia bacterium]
MLCRNIPWVIQNVTALTLARAVPIVRACDKNDAPATTATPKEQRLKRWSSPAVLEKPLKLGAIFPMSGFGAIAGFLADPVIDLESDQVQKQGCIRVGWAMRPLEIRKYDMESRVPVIAKRTAEAVTKDHVTAADAFAVAHIAESNKVPYLHCMGEKALNENYTCTINATCNMAVKIEVPSRFIAEGLKVQTPAYLPWDSDKDRQISEAIAQNLKAAGIKTVYKEFHPKNMIDFSAFFARIEYAAPDILVVYTNLESYLAIFEQIQKLGGWGNMLFYGIAQASLNQWSIRLPGMEGTYHSCCWVPGMREKGPWKFEQTWADYTTAHPDWGKKHETVPDTMHVPFCNCLWLDIKATEFAESDDVATIIKSRRSGNLKFRNSPLGTLAIDKMGYDTAKPPCCNDNRGQAGLGQSILKKEDYPEMTKSIITELFDLGGKVAVVTGGARGIGQQIAFRLAQAGAGVLISDINAKGAAQTAAEIKAKGGKAESILADASSLKDAEMVVQAAVRSFGHLDILVNNAGVVKTHCPIPDVTEDRWDKILDTNLKGMFFYSQAAIKQMIKAGKGGSIVNTASIDAFHVEPHNTVYGISKAGVVMLTKAFAVEMGPQKIRVNAVAPGAIKTPGVAEIMTDFAAGGIDVEGLQKQYTMRTPVGRWGESSDIANAVLYLASDAAAYVTGAILVLDGGLTL